MTAPETLDGWFALHDFRRLDRKAWHLLPAEERHKALAETTELLASVEQLAVGPAGRSATYSVIGHKADLLMFHLRPEVGDLHELEQAFDNTLFASFTTRSYSYLSVTEVSRHGAPEGTTENIEGSPFVTARLYPEIPSHSGYVCFYPMSKRREVTDNWYTLEAPERAELMRAHGRTGRRYAGRVSQIVTG
jgi:peroxiredoxin